MVVGVDGQIVFVEVKTRQSLIIWSVTKQKEILRVMLNYLEIWSKIGSNLQIRCNCNLAFPKG